MNDSKALSELKTVFKRVLLDKYSIQQICRMATALCPSPKSLSFATSEEKDAIYMELRQQIDLQQLPVKANIQQPEPQLSGAAEPSQYHHGLTTSSSQV
jgi:hypothetical protein